MAVPALELCAAGYVYQSKYQKVEALKNATASFEAGRVYAIVGRSGSGKTTLLSLMAGLDVPTSGDILVEGRSIKDLNRDQYRLQTASVIYQDFNLFPLLTALENVMYPLQMQKMPAKQARQRAAELLEQMELPARVGKQYPKMMSGGEQQRVAIARALVNSPAVLLADEPSGNLDSHNRDEIHRLFFDLRERLGQTVVIVTHDENLAAMADREITMSDGLILCGETVR